MRDWGGKIGIGTACTSYCLPGSSIVTTSTTCCYETTLRKKAEVLVRQVDASADQNTVGAFFA